jgi:hypothetical protein
LNGLDLGFFRSVQSLQQQTNCRTIEELIAAVQGAWENSEGETLEKVWLSLPRHMEAIMLDGGGNRYSTPHRSEEEKQLAKADPCSQNLPCSKKAVDTAVAAARKLIAARTKH